ncbi:uncharacterized protein LOC142071241 [Caretta caretta]|uniref:uncharacterized protein LOC142071241 n=1 Tax=Caretta caretta TaxID=8467 RepID=UPI003F4BF87B
MLLTIRRGKVFEGPSPKNRDVKKLDLFGRKVYSTGGLQLRISNQQAIVSRYSYNACSAMANFTELLPSDSCAEFSALVQEGRLNSRASLQVALDGADAATRVMATGVAMRRGSWLQVSGLPYEVQQTIQDLPFDGETLFLEKMDKRLNSQKDSRVTLGSLGLYTPSTQRGPFRPQPPQQCGHQNRQDRSRRRNSAGRRRPRQRSGQGSGQPKLLSGPKPASESTVEDGVPHQRLDPPCLTFLSRLSPFYHAWPRITSDHWVLRTVERGYAIQFCALLPFHPPSLSLFRGPSHKQLFIQEVQSLLSLGAVEEVPQEHRGEAFYSWYFLIPKAKDGLRSILDLRELNKFVKKLRFLMVSLASLISSLDPADWYAAFDLKDAYFHIAIAQPHRKFLRFMVNNSHYQFPVLPFGLSAAPRGFTEFMAVVTAFLRRHRVQVFPHLDDWLIKGRSKTQVDLNLVLSRLTGLRRDVPLWCYADR